MVVPATRRGCPVARCLFEVNLVKDDSLALTGGGGSSATLANWMRCTWAMSNEDNQDRELRERIANQLRATESARTAPATDQELQALKAAASRLDQLLKTGADADVQALRSAAARLDEILASIGRGKDVTGGIKQRRDGKRRDEQGDAAQAENLTAESSGE